MTFTILAHDPEADQVGLGIATVSLAVGGLCPFMTLEGDLVTSQAYARQETGLHVARRLSQGAAWEAIMQELEQTDPFLRHRQIAVVRRQGTLHCYSGPDCRPWTGHRFAEDCVVMGNFLCGEKVLERMASAFVDSKGEPLPERLLRTLEAGRAAGGQADSDGRFYTERSSAVKVVGSGGIEGISDHAVAPVDLRVDMHDNAVSELRRLYQILHPVARYNALRSSNPPETPGLAAWEAENMTAALPPEPLRS